MKTTKRVCSLLLAVVLLLSAFPLTAFAATSSELAKRLSAYLPLVTTVSPLSGTRVYAYKDTTFTSKTTSYYVDLGEEVVVTAISNDGKAVCVFYYSTAIKGYRSKWFSTEDIIGIRSVSVKSYVAKAKVTTYRMKSSTAVTTAGYISQSDKTLGLGTRSVGNTTYTVMAYPVTSKTINGVSGVKYKVAMVAMVANSNSTTDTQNMSYALYKSSGGRLTCGFDGYVNTKGRHEGIDFKKGTGSSVYSLTDGVITRITEGYRGSNGLSTIAIYSASTGKTVIYLHADPVNSLYVGQQISRGQLIAYEDWRGCSSSSGTHTHVEVRDGKRTSAAKSVNDYTLDNSNPTAFWNSQGYQVK